MDVHAQLCELRWEKKGMLAGSRSEGVCILQQECVSVLENISEISEEYPTCDYSGGLTVCLQLFALSLKSSLLNPCLDSQNFCICLLLFIGQRYIQYIIHLNSHLCPGTAHSLWTRMCRFFVLLFLFKKRNDLYYWHLNDTFSLLPQVGTSHIYFCMHICLTLKRMIFICFPINSARLSWNLTAHRLFMDHFFLCGSIPVLSWKTSGSFIFAGNVCSSKDEFPATLLHFLAYCVGPFS